MKRFLSAACCVAAMVLAWPFNAIRAEGVNWDTFLSFPPSQSGRTDAVAIFHQSTLYVLGGEPYRCPDLSPCNDPERGAADYLPSAGTDWLMGQPFDDRLKKLGGGIDGLGRPTAFGGTNGDAVQGNNRTFFYDITLGDQTEPSLARRNFLHTNFAWASDDSGRLYAIGGGPGSAASAANPNVSDVERYDAQTDSWTILTSLPIARASAAAAFDGQGHILVFGGYDALATSRSVDVLSYDIATDMWTVLGQPPMPAVGGNDFSDQRALPGANGKVYIVGGINGPVGNGATRANVYTYEPVTATWGFAPDLITPRHGTALALDDDGWLYALGGRNGVAGLYSNERLDTSAAGTECVIAADCADGVVCNGEEFCVDGNCLDGNPVVCEADEFCADGGICRIKRYDLIDLSALLRGTANGINTAGHMVGGYFDTTEGQWHAFLYDGFFHDLGPGQARAIADDGWIAGESGTAFIIDPNTGERTDLGTLGGLGSVAYGVANGGWVVGQSDTGAGPDRAFLVRGPTAVMEDLGTLGDYSIAHAIDPLGRVLGESLVTGFDWHAHPFVFDSSAPDAVMESLSGTYASGSARAVNDLGHVTGWASYNDDTWGRAFVHDGNEVTRLETITGKSYSIGTDINNSDQVVGYAFGEWVYYPCCGYLWSNNIKAAYFHDGLNAINLNDEMPESSGWNLTYALGINDAGAIIGTGILDAQGRAFLMVPVGLDQDDDGVPDAMDNCLGIDNATQANSDNDSLGDACDNCTLVDNADQRDTDADGYGNICDADLDGNGIINFLDLERFQAVFFQADPHADLDGSGVVNFSDLEIVQRMFFGPPGPSGVAGAGASH